MTSRVPDDAADKLRVVVENWGREVTDAQHRLQEQIRAAASELSQIEGLLSNRPRLSGREELLEEIDRLRRENAELRRVVAVMDQKLRKLENEGPPAADA